MIMGIVLVVVVIVVVAVAVEVREESPIESGQG